MFGTWLINSIEMCYDIIYCRSCWCRLWWSCEEFSAWSRYGFGIDGLEMAVLCYPDVDGLEMLVLCCADVDGLEMVVLCHSDVDCLEMVVLCFQTLMVFKWLNLLMGIYVGKCSSMFYLVILLGNFLIVGLLILQCLLCTGWGHLGLKKSISWPWMSSDNVFTLWALSWFSFCKTFFSMR